MHHTCRLLLIDDNDDYLDGLSDWLARQHRVEVIGRAHTRSEARKRIDELSPDLVVVAAWLPDGSGYDLTKELTALPDSPLVVLMSFHGGPAAEKAAVEAGADEFLSKTDGFHELASLVESLFETRREPGSHGSGGNSITEPADEASK